MLLHCCYLAGEVLHGQEGLALEVPFRCHPVVVMMMMMMVIMLMMMMMMNVGGWNEVLPSKYPLLAILSVWVGAGPCKIN
jgi:hypothetical protein